MIPNELTPSERFKAILKDSLVLLMKKYHFKKKGTKFIYEGKNLSYFITTYKSRWNTKESLEFRVEWGVEINEERKKPEIPFKAEALYGDLGGLTKNVNLRWFEVKTEDADPLAHDKLLKEKISGGIELTILPFLFSFQSIEDIIKILETTPDKEVSWGTPVKGGQTLRFLASFYYFIGKPEKSLEFIDKAIKSSKVESFKQDTEELKRQIVLNMHKK